MMHLIDATCPALPALGMQHQREASNSPWMALRGLRLRWLHDAYNHERGSEAPRAGFPGACPRPPLLRRDVLCSALDTATPWQPSFPHLTCCPGRRASSLHPAEGVSVGDFQTRNSGVSFAHDNNTHPPRKSCLKRCILQCRLAWARVAWNWLCQIFTLISAISAVRVVSRNVSFRPPRFGVSTGPFPPSPRICSANHWSTIPGSSATPTRATGTSQDGHSGDLLRMVI